jgi:hypothetical protein
MPRSLKGKVCWWVFIDGTGEVECSEISITSTISSTTSNLCVPMAEQRVFLVRLRLMYEKTVPPDIAQQAKQGVLEADLADVFAAPTGQPIRLKRWQGGGGDY